MRGLIEIGTKGLFVYMDGCSLGRIGNQESREGGGREGGMRRACVIRKIPFLLQLTKEKTVQEFIYV